MSNPIRIDIDEARRRVQSGQALLVCAYDDEAKCRSLGIDGSKQLAELEAENVPKTQEIVFYCA